MAIVYKIHPALGVARVGNAPDEFFIGPESADELVQPPGGFKDASCRVKRQAVRFYIFEHDTATGTAAEITDQVPSITWHFTPVCGKFRHGTSVFEEAEITGRLDRDTFSLQIHDNGATPDVVPFGELRSDDQGRLVFLGGFGTTGAIPGNNPPIPSTSEDPYWYDDLCEGRITATFHFAGHDQTIHAWALIAPPRSRPHEPPVPSLYDVMRDTAIANGFTIPAADPGSAAALDKAQLAFVSGAPPGLELRMEVVVNLYPAASVIDPQDPFRLPPPSSGTFLTNFLPNPWQIDDYNCGWFVWDQSDFSDAQDLLANWPRAGIRVKQGDTFVVAEKCNAEFEITLLTPSLDFGQVAEGPSGMTGSALRAVVFEVSSTLDSVLLEYATEPSAPFSKAATDPGDIGPTVGGPQTVRFWIRYTTTADPPPATDPAVVIQVHGTSTTWTIPLHAETVQRRVTATALVLDRSGSMVGETAPGVTKYEALQVAAGSFLDLALDGDFIQLVHYDDQAQAIPLLTSDGISGSGVTELDVTTRFTLGEIVSDGVTFAPNGSTSIGAGILTARDRLNSAPATTSAGQPVHRALVILTDGIENTPPSVQSVASSIDANTYAIGLGTSTNTSAAVLQTLAGNNGGYLLVTGEITGDKAFVLQKYFLQILAGINKAEIVLDPSGLLVPGEQVAIPFFVSDLDAGLEIIALSGAPHALDFRLLTPAAKLLEPWRAATDPGVEFGLTSRLSYFRLALPAEAEPGVIERAGRWHALLSLGRPRLQPTTATLATRGPQRLDARSLVALRDERQAVISRALRVKEPGSGKRTGVPYSLLVNAYSSAALRASLDQKSFEPGATVTIHASFLDSGALPLHEATLRVELVRPDTSTVTLTMAAVPNDPGRFRSSFVAQAVGLYTCRVVARGKTSK
ncbi:MAG TPA: LodA/GoxA family CTQ-dependent oxidase, partial [Polyangiaceae bacterium]